jgi:hypothetical protein
MKKVKSLLLLSVFSLSLAILWQCKETDPCGCPDVTKPFTELNAIKLTNFDKLTFSSDSTRIKMTQFSITIETLITLTASIEKQKNIHNPFINSALACDCVVDGFKGLKNKVTQMEVFLLTDYDDKYKKGAEISDLVSIRRRFDNFGPTFNTKTIISDFNLNSFFSGQFSLEMRHSEKFSDAVINTKAGIPFALEMIITMEDGTEFKSKSREVKLIP